MFHHCLFILEQSINNCIVFTLKCNAFSSRVTIDIIEHVFLKFDVKLRKIWVDSKIEFCKLTEVEKLVLITLFACLFFSPRFLCVCMLYTQ